MDGNKKLKLAVDDYIEGRRLAAIEVLRDLLKFRTIVGSPYRGIQEYLAEKLSRLGLDIDLWEPKMADYIDLPWFDAPPSYYPDGFKDKPVLVGTWAGAGDRSIILNAHVDVITPDPLSLWSCDPWEGVIRDGRIFGRGVIDTKGGLAAATMALEALKKSGFTPGGRIHFMSALDQEVNGAGTIAAIKRGYRADVALIMEPTNFDIALATVGAFWLRISVEGKAAHAAAVWEGVNAAEKAIAIHLRIREKLAYREKLQHPLYAIFPSPAAFNLGTFASGGYPSSVPEEARLEYRLAALPGETNAKIIEEIKEVVFRFALEDPWLREHLPRVTTYGWYADPTEIERDHPLVHVLEANFNEVVGRKPKLVGMTYGCDAGRLWMLSKIKSVVFAPGDLWAHAHKPDESLKVDEYIQYIRILAHSLIDWFS
jgi:acetylornithine deacetylase